MKYNILIVEDNEVLSSNIKKYLEIKWIKSFQLFSWKWVILELVTNSYDAIILDIWLPDISWLEICEIIREKWINIPILILTSRSMTQDKILGLESWADDYLTKPFEYDELIARIHALIRRNMNIKAKIIEIWNIKIDIDKKTIFNNNIEVSLSSTEFNLLLYLCQKKWSVLSKEEIYTKVWWEFDEFENSRKVDVYVWYLRKKLWKDIVETRRWEWYIIN